MMNASDFNFDNVTDEQLTTAIRGKKSNNRSDQEVIEFRRREIDIFQAELDRRALEVFWAQHPGERLNVGDKLLVTQEHQDWYKAAVNGPNWGLSEVVFVYEIHPELRSSIRVSARGGLTGNIPLAIARNMRAAGLAQQAGET